MTTTKDHLLQTLVSEYEPKVSFVLPTVYDLVLNADPSRYAHLKDAQSTIRRDLQELRDEGYVTFVDYEGTYYINPTASIDPTVNIFSLEELERHGRILPAPGVHFERWAILNKDEVMSHAVARELDIPCQTRVGRALFLKTIEEITNEVYNNGNCDGYDYRCWQPAVSALSEPVEYNGKTYRYIVRNGNNRYELPWNYYPCAIISGDTEYSLLQYGAISNNPSKEKKNDLTDADVKYMIQLGFEYGEIEKTEEAVYDVLATLYKEIRKKDRRNFVAEILLESGIQVSIEPYDIQKAKQHLKDNYQVELGDHDYIMGWGRGADSYRKFHWIYQERLKNPDVEMIEYAFLEMGQGVKVQPTEENARTQRILLESERKEYINHCCDVADAHRSGQLKRNEVKWLAQVNSNEKFNEFQ